MKKYLKTKNILLAIGVVSLSAVIVGKIMGTSKFRNFTPYVSKTICMKGSEAGENREEFMVYGRSLYLK